MDEPVFDIRGLEFAYEQGGAVLQGVDLRILGGRFYGILGRNGCGKSTLLDLMTGFLKPLRGTILLRGRRIQDYSRRELASILALAPQEFTIDFPFSVWEALLMGRYPHLARFASVSERDLRIVQQALATLSLEGFAHKLVTELSGGEKQRVALARVLAQDTPVILLDEPTSNLDVNHSLQVMGVMERLVRERGRSVIAVMHELTLAAAFCDHLVLLSEGQVVAAGPTVQVLTPQNLADVFGVEARVGWDDFAEAYTVVLRKRAGGE